MNCIISIIYLNKQKKKNKTKNTMSTIKKTNYTVTEFLAELKNQNNNSISLVQDNSLKNLSVHHFSPVQEALKFRFEKFEDIQFISSLSYLPSRKIKTKNKNNEPHKPQILVSTKLFPGQLNYENIFKILKLQLVPIHEIHIIQINWEYNNMNFWDYNSTDNIVKEEFEGKDFSKFEFKLIIYNMNLNSFSKLLSSSNPLFKINKLSSRYEQLESRYLGFNPIIIFKGIHWGNIVYFFKLKNLTLNGGSLTRRHKLTMNDYKLSQFLNLIKIFQYNKDKFFLHDVYEGLFGHSFFKESTYISILQNWQKEFEKPAIYNFLQANIIIYNILRKEEINNLIIKLQNSNTSENELEKKIKNLISEFENINDKIEHLFNIKLYEE